MSLVSMSFFFNNLLYSCRFPPGLSRWRPDRRQQLHSPADLTSCLQCLTTPSITKSIMNNYVYICIFIFKVTAVKKKNHSSRICINFHMSLLKMSQTNNNLSVAARQDNRQKNKNNASRLGGTERKWNWKLNYDTNVLVAYRKNISELTSVLVLDPDPHRSACFCQVRIQIRKKKCGSGSGPKEIPNKS